MCAGCHAHRFAMQYKIDLIYYVYRKGNPDAFSHIRLEYVHEMVVSGWCWTVSVSAICCLHKHWRFEHQLILHGNKCWKNVPLLRWLCITWNEIRWLHTAACICFNIFATLVFLSTRFVFIFIFSSFDDEQTVCAKDIPMIRFLSSYYSIRFFSSVHLSCCMLRYKMHKRHTPLRWHIHTKTVSIFHFAIALNRGCFHFLISMRLYIAPVKPKAIPFQQASQFHTVSIFITVFLSLSLCLSVCLSVSKFDYPVLSACRSIFQPIWWALRDGI